MFALVDHPDWMAEAILTGARDQQRVRREFQAAMREAGHEHWYGGAGWMPFWRRSPSSASSPTSPACFRRDVRPFRGPRARRPRQEHGALWYHLDGGNARQHLPRLLSLPYMRVIQYTPAPGEPPNGPGHLEMYRRIQAAGRIVHIAVPPGTSSRSFAGSIPGG